jgi:hypothetical protein
MSIWLHRLRPSWRPFATLSSPAAALRPRIRWFTPPEQGIFEESPDGLLAFFRFDSLLWVRIGALVVPETDIVSTSHMSRGTHHEFTLESRPQGPRVHRYEVPLSGLDRADLGFSVEDYDVLWRADQILRSVAWRTRVYRLP